MSKAEIEKSESGNTERGASLRSAAAENFYGVEMNREYNRVLRRRRMAAHAANCGLLAAAALIGCIAGFGIGVCKPALFITGIILLTIAIGCVLAHEHYSK